MDAHDTCKVNNELGKDTNFAAIEKLLTSNRKELSEEELLILFNNGDKRVQESVSNN